MGKFPQRVRYAKPVSNIYAVVILSRSIVQSNVMRHQHSNKAVPMGGATGVCGAGQCPPPLLGPGVQGGTGGRMKMIFASTADSLYSVAVQVTEFQLP